MSTSVTTILHIHAGTKRERDVEVTAQVSLYAGRYRVDDLTVLNGGYLTDTEQVQAYDQLLDHVRYHHPCMWDDAREDLRHYA